MISVYQIPTLLFVYRAFVENLCLLSKSISRDLEFIYPFNAFSRRLYHERLIQ